MVRIAISQSAFDAIMASMQLGSVGAENATDEQGQRLIWLEPQVLAGLRALRWPSESYSDVIIRMAAYNAEERSVIEVQARPRRASDQGRNLPVARTGARSGRDR